MKVEPANLKAPVAEVLRTSKLQRVIGGFELDEGRDDDGVEFIRVVFDVDGNAHVPDEDLVGFADHIENALALLDERFASVRFSDAAWCRPTMTSCSTLPNVSSAAARDSAASSLPHAFAEAFRQVTMPYSTFWLKKRVCA
jgi:hypothetical protein